MPLLLTAIGVAVYAAQPAAKDLVVYCAHDSVYSAPFLRRFTEEIYAPAARAWATARRPSSMASGVVARAAAASADIAWPNSLLSP